MTQPDNRHGKVCYLIMPSNDPQQSADFYATVFDWQVRSHGDGTLAFDDATGQVSGMWVTDRQAVDDPGMEVHIMVRNATEARQLITANGGSLVWQSGTDDQEQYGTFRDPSGNLLGYYEHRDSEA